jgi:uncharacterized damage-inducible protein DinB
MIPPPQFFTHLFDYVKWADLRQLDSTRLLADDEYYKERGWSFGSIHKMLLHMLSAQSIWLDRFTGGKPIWLFDEPRLAKRDAIEPQWKQVHERGSRFFAEQTSQSLASAVAADKFARPLWQLAIHLCNHSTYHRGQLNSMIQLAGGRPVETDYSIYARDFAGK